MAKFKLNKKIVISVLIVIGIAAAAVGAGASLRWWQEANQDLINPQPLPETVEKAQNKALVGDFDGAHAAITEELAKDNLSAQEKYELYFQQGATYHNQAKYKEALDSYKLAATARETQDLYMAMADSAELFGDNQGAISHLQKAITLISPENPVGEDDKKALELRIQALQGGGSQ